MRTLRIMGTVALSGAIFTGALAGVALPANAAVPTTGPPIGNLDAVTLVDGGIRVAGWAWDPDAGTSTTVSIAVGATVTRVAASASRPDVARVIPKAGALRGFSVVVPTADWGAEVCVTAVNTGAGSDKKFACKRPALSRTGVPVGTGLTVHDGDLTVTTAGAVVDSMDIRGYLRIKAANVTVKNSIVRGRAGLGNTSMALVQNSSPGLVIQDTEIVAQYPTFYVDGFVGSNARFTRVNIHGVVDSIKIIGDNVVVEDSWLHDNLYYAQVPSGGDTHNDNVQIGVGQNITIRNNTMTGTRNAVLMITQDRGPVGNLSFSKNRVDNGACSVNLAEKSHGPLQGLRFTDNVFGTAQLSSRCAIIAPDSTARLLTLASNVFTDGKTVTVSRG